MNSPMILVMVACFRPDNCANVAREQTPSCRNRSATNARLMSWLLSWLMLLCVMISFISKNSYTPKFIF